MSRLGRALLLPALAALGCAGAPAPRVMVAAATISPPPNVAAATIAPPPNVAAATIAPPAPAAFPDGWVRAAPAPLDLRRPPSSLSLGPQRTIVAPTPLRLADLPLIEVTPTPTDAERPGPNVLSPPGEPSREIFVAKGCSRVSVRNHAVGEISVGWGTLPIAPQSGGGVMFSPGGDGHDRYTLASWRTLDRAPGGGLIYRETQAWFDMLTCKAFDVRHMEAVAQPLVGGLNYAFRTHCASCKAGTTDRLHLIMPNRGWGDGSFDHREIALAPGLSTSQLDTFSDAALRRFRASGAATTRAGDVTVGLEVVQGIGEPEPTAMIYVSDARLSNF
ncbi:MAG: hypothetical protein ABJE95_27890 [Byssovorax sp.]